MLRTIRLHRVRFMPKVLEPGILYVSEEFGAVAHLCACGCGAKIRTPIGPTGWRVTETSTGPSLYPSVGNWQQSCRSHYWIDRGRIFEAPPWTEEEAQIGRVYQLQRDRAFYEQLGRKRRSIPSRMWDWVKNMLG